MAKELTKFDGKGNRYRRPPKIEAAIDAALTQNFATLRVRAAIQDDKAPNYLPSECLLYLIRDARRRNDEVLMNAFVPLLLARCEAMLRRLVELREEILGQFAELLAEDGTGTNPNELDFYEVRFNSAFLTFRIDVLRHQRTRLDHEVLISDLSDDENSSTDDVVADLSEGFHTLPNQESNLDLKILLRTLPPEERRVVILHHIMGYEIESEDPTKNTVATRCGVTGRTIRNRLRRADAKLKRFKEGML